MDYWWFCLFGFSLVGEASQSPNDPKLSDRGVRRGSCVVGGKAAAEAATVTHGAVRCSAWLGDVRFGEIMAVELLVDVPQATPGRLGKRIQPGPR